MIPIFIAVLIYLLFRSKSLLLYKWIGIDQSIDLVGMNKSVSVKNTIIIWILFSLPDGLWLYSLTAIMILIWGKETTLFKYFFIYLGFFIAVFHEFGQYLHIFRGTFDMGDILAYIICMFAALLITNYRGRKLDEKVL